MSEENPFHRPALLGDILSKLIRRKGLAETSAVDQLDVAWKQAVGAELASRSSAARLRGGVLEVVVTNSAAMEQLRSYLNQSVLEKLQAALPQSGIRSIRYVRPRR